MADGTKEVVGTSVADDEAAPAGAAGDTPAEGPAAESPAEATAPLSAAEIAAELTSRKAAPAAAEPAEPAEPAADPADEAADPEPAEEAPDQDAPAGDPPVEDEDFDPAATLDQPTGELPLLRPAPDRHSGDRIADRYRLEECITQSEFFSSWRAVDEKLRRAVGVHLLAAGHQRARGVLAAAKSAALLGDPRFVQVLDAVQEGDHVYVIREWLPGAADLAQLLADGPLEPYDAYQMARQVTEAIAAAHRRGQAHLRLTPRCVLRTESGQYRINGIAVDAALRGLPDDDAALTDTRAIGALLYAALTHRWPFPEDRYDLQGLPKNLGCVPPDQVRAGVHKGLSEIAARALCEHPPHHQDPITTPEDLAKALALMPKIRQPELPPPTFAPPPPRPQPQHPARPQQTGPAAEPPTLVTTGPRRPGPSRPRLRRLVRVTASVVALAAIGVASWQLVSILNKQTDKGVDGHQPTPSESSTATPAAPPGKAVPIAGALSFNALGDQPEHKDETQLAYDGNPATSWQTAGYYQDLGGAYKAGTGLLVDLGSVQQVGSVQVQLVGSTKIELRAAPEGTTAAPAVSKAGLDSFGSAVAAETGSTVELKPGKPLSTRYLLLWLTGVPKDVSDEQYRGKIAEVKVTG
ncbi:protein kinase family protein [Kitasatospora sp. NPDC002040]|uniref:protein kinase family protein n=1 Tax=Kitasatospora sp. NPDC002040 TaxID=3154661 RepID=UPI00332251D7